MIQDAAEAAAQFLNAYHARQFVESSCDQNLIDELMFACKGNPAQHRRDPCRHGWREAARTTKAILTQNSGTASTRGCDMENATTLAGALSPQKTPPRSALKPTISKVSPTGWQARLHAGDARKLRMRTDRLYRLARKGAMSNSVIAIAARFSRRPAPPVPRSGGAVAGERSGISGARIERMRSAKVACGRAKMRSDIAAEEAQSDLNKAIDAYEERGQTAGLLCRK